MTALLITGLVLQGIGIIFKLIVILYFIRADESSELFGYSFASIWFSIFFEVVMAISLSVI